VADPTVRYFVATLIARTSAELVAAAGDVDQVFTRPESADRVRRRMLAIGAELDQLADLIRRSE